MSQCDSKHHQPQATATYACGGGQLTPPVSTMVDPSPSRLHSQAPQNEIAPQRGCKNLRSPDITQTTQCSTPEADGEPEWEMKREPNTRPVTLDQLVSEIRGIYAALVKVEDECIESVSKFSEKQGSISKDEWNELLILHQTALYEFCDFFFATRHPVAAKSEKLKNVITKYSMPARLWRHAIYRLLDLMRKHLSESQVYIHRFIGLAFNMITVLYENTQDLSDVWAECLGDLARFRMAIESDLTEDRALYLGIAKYWYRRSIDLDPGVGQRYHHISILSRPALLEQLFNYTKSLCSTKPFATSKETILSLFTQVDERRTEGCPPVEIALVNVHRAIMLNSDDKVFHNSLDQLVSELEEFLLGKNTVGAAENENSLNQFL